MPWLQLSLEAGDIDPETLSAFFEEQGALSVTFVDAADQPLFEPAPGTTPLWSATRITALFDTGVDRGTLQQRLAGQFGPGAAARLVEETLADQDWERVWLEQFKPMRFGARLWVCPAGQAPPVEGDTVIIDVGADDLGDSALEEVADHEARDIAEQMMALSPGDPTGPKIIDLIERLEAVRQD